MRRVSIFLLLAPAVLAGCATDPDRRTLAGLRAVEADLQEVRVTDGLDRAMYGYRSYLEAAPESERTPEAMRRLADLQVEKEFGILGDGTIMELPAPEPGPGVRAASRQASAGPEAEAVADGDAESQVEFERRATAEQSVPAAMAPLGGEELAYAGGEIPAGPSEAIELYKRILATYPSYPHNDQVLYQKSRAYDEVGLTEDAMRVMERLIREYPHSRYIDEIQFRRGEYFFTRRQYLEAEAAYTAVTSMGIGSTFHELALYKLGWTFYKQDFYEEALHEFVALLDYKVATGYDFDQPYEEADERRVADTFRVVSLSFSTLGPPEVVQEYFGQYGNRSYEDRIYRHLGEFYFDKLRFNDAAKVYNAFVELYPLHRVSPHFSMRVVDIYAAGGFPMLVVQAKKDFANSYGRDAEYWRHFDIGERPEVLSFLKSNLEDLAVHYHALYQDELLADEQFANYHEAQHWYRVFLASFPQDEDTPAVHYQLADLLFEGGDFGLAALEYEKTAYDYPAHEQAAAAGYAAVYAHREQQKLAGPGQRDEVRREAVESSLRFSATFPEHEHAAMVLGAAADDLYEMQEFERALVAGHTLIERYPDAALPLRRSAWIIVAHSSFDLQDYAAAELAYSSVLGLTAADDPSGQGFVDNLAASIYKQGELANVAGDYRTAADHFLRIRHAAPTSGIRAAAEYDAGAALMRLEDWAMAAEVLEDFRATYPEHELNREATRQIAYVYREDGQIARAAAEYERISAEAEDPELAREALLLAGELYEDAKAPDRALDVYLRYVDLYPDPLEVAVETRHKIAARYKETFDQDRYHEQLRAIVAIDAAAGSARTDRTRYLAALSGLVLAEELHLRFEDVRLVQPFERSLQEKQRRMDAALAAFTGLVDYEVGEVTAAATFYIAEVYFGFSQALLSSERPANLGPDELMDYEMVIEEEAFPFEERAIEVHEKNLELLVAGEFNDWVERSLDKLAELMPGRYAKFELSSGFLASLDFYAYRSPLAPDLEFIDLEPSDLEASEESGEDPDTLDEAWPADDEPEGDIPQDEITGEAVAAR
jgi:cellulose synthase operon protein C